MNTEDENYSPIHPAKQLAYLFLVFFGCSVLGLVISLLLVVLIYGMGMFGQVLSLSANPTPDQLGAFRILLALGNSVFPFLVTAIFFGYFIVQDVGNSLKTNFRPNWIFLLLGLLVLAIMFGAAPSIEALGNFNQKLHFSGSLSWLQEWMEKSEQGVEQTEAIILNMKSPSDLVISMILIGFLPAISEEFIFRGALQSIFKQWTKNTHAAVWITAIIFSFIHFEFFGFLPRVLLGAVLGYFVAWTGNIWLSVWGHFINNGTAVLMLYLFQHKISSINPDGTHLYTTSIYIFSSIITLILLLAYKKIADAKLQVQYEGDEED